MISTPLPPQVIELTQSKTAIIDAADWARVAAYKWSADKHRNTFYARARIGGKVVFLHQWLNPGCRRVDHKDRDGLNNRRSNFRCASATQNLCNRGPQKNNKSGYKGVSWSKSARQWVVQISYRRRHRVVGYFDDVIEAAHAYDSAARKHHKKFAFLNFP